MSKRKPEIVWGIRRHGRLIPMLMRTHRKYAIHAACRLFTIRGDPIDPWENRQRNGYTVHKLEVRDVR